MAKKTKRRSMAAFETYIQTHENNILNFLGPECVSTFRDTADGLARTAAMLGEMGRHSDYAAMRETHQRNVEGHDQLVKEVMDDMLADLREWRAEVRASR